MQFFCLDRLVPLDLRIIVVGKEAKVTGTVVCDSRHELRRRQQKTGVEKQPVG